MPSRIPTPGGVVRKHSQSQIDQPLGGSCQPRTPSATKRPRGSWRHSTGPLLTTQVDHCATHSLGDQGKLSGIQADISSSPNYEPFGFQAACGKGSSQTPRAKTDTDSEISPHGTHPPRKDSLMHANVHSPSTSRDKTLEPKPSTAFSPKDHEVVQRSLLKSMDAPISNASQQRRLSKEDRLYGPAQGAAYARLEPSEPMAKSSSSISSPFASSMKSKLKVNQSELFTSFLSSDFPIEPYAKELFPCKRFHEWCLFKQL